MKGGGKSVKVPKSIDLDFKKKKVKVGRKVKRANVTKIKVQSKNIHMPLQNVDKSILERDEHVTLEKLKKHLSHHSPHARQSALIGIKVALKAALNAQSYTAIIFPPMMELLFDEEKSVRQTLLEVMSDLFSLFPTSTFTTINSILGTYLCSGLTNLVKAIRKDSVRLLLSLLNSHPASLSLQYTEVILSHLLNILSDTVKSTSQDTSILDVNATNSSNNTSQKAPNSFLLTLLQSIHLCTKNAATSFSSSEARLGSSVGHSGNPARVQHSIGNFHNEARTRMHRVSLSGGFLGVEAATTGKATEGLESVYSRVCQRLYKLWEYTLSAQSALTQGVLSVLTEIAFSLEQLANLPNVAGSTDFTSFLDALLGQFPYKSNTNATTSISHGSRKAEGLNLIICQLVFQALSSQDSRAQKSDRSLAALRSMNSFVVEDLTHFVERAVRSGTPHESAGDNEIIDEPENAVVEGRAAPQERGGRGSSASKAHSSSHSNSQRLFESVRCSIRLGVQLEQSIEDEVSTVLKLLTQLCDESNAASKLQPLTTEFAAITALEAVAFLELSLRHGSARAHEIAVGIIKVANSLTKAASRLPDATILVSKVAQMLRSVFSMLPSSDECAGDEQLSALQVQTLHDIFNLVFANASGISTDVQMLVVDLFYYCPLGSLAEEAGELGATACSSSVNYSVQLHFVRLLTERRHEVAPHDFLGIVTGIIESYTESAVSNFTSSASSHSVALFEALGEAVLKCSSSDAPWKILNFAASAVTSLCQVTESDPARGLLYTSAAMYLQLSLLRPWRAAASAPSIVLDEESLSDHRQAESEALLLVLRGVTHCFDHHLRLAALKDFDSVSMLFPALQFRASLPSTVFADLHCTADSSTNDISILEIILADISNRPDDMDKITRTLGFLERLLRPRPDRVAVTEAEKEQIFVFTKVVKSSNQADSTILSLCNNILGHSD